ncbi:ribbon-helix-helix protein, CopG family [Leptothoe sp. EHU-05/26/07-4]
MGKSVASKVWASVSDKLAKRLNTRADEEGQSRSALIAYLLERAMEDWQPADEIQGATTADNQTDKT